MSTTVVRSAVVPFSTREMFDLVNDIEQYPHFLPWCPNATILSRTEDEIQATLHLMKGVLSKSFTTVNRLLPHNKVEMRLLKGPFRHLEGCWEFESLQNEGCKITFQLSFEFSNKLLSLTMGPIFHQMIDTLIHAFTHRAHQLYAR